VVRIGAVASGAGADGREGFKVVLSLG
jgi:hypothetical protein